MESFITIPTIHKHEYTSTHPHTHTHNESTVVYTCFYSLLFKCLYIKCDGIHADVDTDEDEKEDDDDDDDVSTLVITDDI